MYETKLFYNSFHFGVCRVTPFKSCFPNILKPTSKFEYWNLF